MRVAAKEHAMLKHYGDHVPLSEVWDVLPFQQLVERGYYALLREHYELTYRGERALHFSHIPQLTRKVK